MSRRSVKFKKLIAQAGGDVNKIIPQNAVGRGVYGKGIPKELIGELGKSRVGTGRGKTVTVGMTNDTEARVRKLKS